MFRRKQTHNNLKENAETEGVITDFLENEYLLKEYIVPADIDSALKGAVIRLCDEPGFRGLTNVGSTANGSLELRRRIGGKQASDLDFYLIGTSEFNMTQASETIRQLVQPLGISLDGVLNGLSDDNYLNIDAIDDVINRGDSALLALLFQSYYGIQQNELQLQILNQIVNRDDKQEVWDIVTSFHAQSLSLHHGSFESKLSNRIMDEMYPQKVARFELPETVEEMIETTHAIQSYAS